MISLFRFLRTVVLLCVGATAFACQSADEAATMDETAEEMMDESGDAMDEAADEAGGAMDGAEVSAEPPAPPVDGPDDEGARGEGPPLVEEQPYDSADVDPPDGDEPR